MAAVGGDTMTISTVATGFIVLCFATALQRYRDLRMTVTVDDWFRLRSILMRMKSDASSSAQECRIVAPRCHALDVEYVRYVGKIWGEPLEELLDECLAAARARNRKRSNMP
jgi:hypothetical protein